MARTLGTGMVVLLSANVGCSEDETTPSGGGGSGAATGSTHSVTPEGTSATTSASGSAGTSTGGMGLDIVWTPCPLSSDGDPGPTVECATIRVPLRWDDPSGEKIDFFVKRLPATMQPSRGQAWFLNGGPGYSGADFDYMPIPQRIDVYLPDHRGTGRSSRLSCPTAEAEASEDGIEISHDEIVGCVDELVATWGDRLDGFTMSHAARDVGEVIAATRRPDDDIVVYGGSYGTALANRYMVLYPGQAGAVVLDAPAVTSKLDRFDAWENDLGRAWAEACAGDATCASHLGSDPWATWTDALAAFDAGACPGIAALGYDRAFLIDLWGQFFYRWDLRPAILPMVARLARCGPGDVAAYDALLDALVPPPPDAARRYFSRMLSAHITLSELWSDPPPTLASIDAFRATANVGHPLARQLASVYEAWPRYPHDAHFGELANVPTPVLTMHGQYDFVPAADAETVGAHFSGPHQTYVEIPRAPHGTAGAPAIDGGPSCSQKLFGQFINAPLDPLDTSCLVDVAPLDFSLPADYALALFGTADGWGDAPASGPPPPPRVAPRVVTRALEEVARALPRGGPRRRLPPP